MNRKNAIWLVLALLLLVSCKTPVAEQKEPVDLHPSMQLLFDSRPQDSEIDIIQDIKTLDDVIHNSGQYLMAWELWESYAESLEIYIKKIGDMDLYSL